MHVLSTSEAITQHGRAVVRRRLARGTWQRPTRGVVVTHNGPLSTIERQAVIVAASPPGSALAGLTSLKLAGLTGFDAEHDYLVVPNGGRKPDLTGIEMHQSIHLDLDDVLAAHWPRRTRNARSVIDAASWASNDRLARAITIASFQQRLVSTRQMREALQRRPTQRRRGLVIESILDASGGIQSLPERDFEDARRHAGLSKPIRQRPVRGKDGRYFLDAWFEDEQLAVEVHGIPHLAVRHWDADLFRANEIVIGGDRVLAFSSYAVRHERAVVIDQLQRARVTAA